jgi:hypothetical protein
MTTTTQPIADPIAVELEHEGVAHRTCDELPEEVYHARPEYSTSMLKLLPGDPETFFGRHVLRLPDFQFKPTQYVNFGTVAHGMFLQDKATPIIPVDVLSKSGARQGGAWKDFAADHEGEIWLKAEEAEPLKRLQDSLEDTGKAKELLALPGKTEHSVFWQSDIGGFNLRGRLDRLVLMGDKAIVLDLKLTNNLSPEKFYWHAADMGYHYQAASYMWAVREVFDVEPTAFVFIVGEYNAPYRWFTYEASSEFLDAGWIALRESLAALRHRLDTNNWIRDDRSRLLSLKFPQKSFT